MGNWSVRTRLTTVFSTVVAVALVLIGAGVVTMQQRADRAALDRLLRVRSGQVTELVDELKSGASIDLATVDQARAAGVQAAVLTADGTIVARDDGAVTIATQRRSVRRALIGHRPGQVFVREGLAKDDFRVLVEQSEHHGLNAPSVLVMASMDLIDDHRQRLVAGMVAGGIVTWLVCTVLAWLLARGALAPIERMRTQAEQIVHDGRLSRRLDVPATGDEVAAIATTFNAVIERLEELFEAERRFVEDANHELRTPLATAQTALENAQASAADGDMAQLARSLDHAAEAITRSSRLSNTLLARGRTGSVELELVDLSSVARRAAERWHARAGVRTIDAAVAVVPVEAIGDPMGLDQIVDNLVDNALRHGDGAVTIAAGQDSRGAWIEVSDLGSLATAGSMFERGVSSEGSGLGLDIAERLAVRMGGTLTLESQRPETAFRLTLPAERPPGDHAAS